MYVNQMTDEQRTVFTRHELFPAIEWTKRLNQCSVEGICVMIEVLSLFTVSPLLLSAITQCMRTVSHKSLLHKLSSSLIFYHKSKQSEVNSYLSLWRKNETLRLCTLPAILACHRLQLSKCLPVLSSSTCHWGRVCSNTSPTTLEPVVSSL